jgi:hypothetical protein
MLFRERYSAVEVEVDTVVRETNDAILCAVGKEVIDIPKTLIDEASEVKAPGDSGALVVPLWLARDRGVPFTKRG